MAITGDRLTSCSARCLCRFGKCSSWVLPRGEGYSSRRVADLRRIESGSRPHSAMGCGCGLNSEPAHDTDQLSVRGALRIAEFGDRVRVGKFTEVDQFADALLTIQRQLARPACEQEMPQLALAEQMVELACRQF